MPVSKSTKVTRNNMIQVFRALSIIAVVMIHTTPPGEWQVICRPFLNFAVATFLFLSGYLTKIENDDWYAFCRKRIIRVFIPYVIWTVIFTLLHNGGIPLLVKNLVTAKAETILYYIFVYIQFVLLTPLLGKLAKSKYRHLGWLIAPVSTLIFKYYGLLTGYEYHAYVSLFWSRACLGWFTYYYLGLLLGNQIIKPNYSLKTLLYLYFVSIILQMIEGYGWYLLGNSNCGTQLKMTSFITSTIFLLIIYDILNNPNIDIKNRFIRSLGDYSFGIYLCHVMIIIFLGHMHCYTVIPYPLNSVIILLISWAFCYLGNKILGSRICGWIGLK